MFKKELNFKKFSNYAYLILKTYENDLDKHSDSYKQLFEDLNKNQEKIINVCCLYFKEFQPDDLYNIYNTKSLNEILSDDKNLDNLLSSNIIHLIDVLIYSFITCKKDNIHVEFRKKFFFSYFYPVLFFMTDVMFWFSTDYIEGTEKVEKFHIEVLGKTREEYAETFASLDYQQNNIETIRSNAVCQKALSELIGERLIMFCTFLNKKDHLKNLNEDPTFSVLIAVNCMAFFDIMIKWINFSDYVFDNFPKETEFLYDYMIALWNETEALEETFLMVDLLTDLPITPEKQSHIIKNKGYWAKHTLILTVYLWIFLISENPNLQKLVWEEILRNPKNIAMEE